MKAIKLINFFETVTDCKLAVYNPVVWPVDEVEPGETYLLEITGPFGYSQRIDWKTPLKEESFPRALITCFCSKYRKMNPDLLPGKPTEEECEKNATIWNKGFTYSKFQVRDMLKERFHALPFSQRFFGLLCPTLYGIGVWVVFGARQDLIDKVAGALKDSGIAFENDWSNAHWVYRFRTGLDRDTNEAIIASITAKQSNS